MAKRIFVALVAIVMVWPGEVRSQGQDAESKSTYKYLSVTKRWKNLRAPYDIVSTKDSAYFYVSSYQHGGIGIFKRDVETGEINNIDVLEGRKGMVHLDLNDDETRAVGCSYESGLYLFKRNPEDGSLKEIFHLENSDEIENSLTQPMSLVLSPDGQFVYVVDEGTGMLSVFKIVEDEIVFVHKHDGVDGCLDGARLLTMDSTGEFLFVAAGKEGKHGTFSIFDRDSKAGHVRILACVSDEKDGVTKLAGAHGVALSPDDKFAYVVCGRFGGDDSICVFDVSKKKEPRLVQQWEPAAGKPFSGGSHIGVSPDGKQVIATAWKSKNIAHFSRDVATGKIEFQSFLIFKDKTEVGKTTQPYFSPDGKFLNLGSYSGNVLTYQNAKK